MVRYANFHIGQEFVPKASIMSNMVRLVGLGWGSFSFKFDFIA
jgi:hypothetical protein